MKVEIFPLGLLGSNCYIASNNNEAYIIDCDSYSEKVTNYIIENDFKVKALLLTHGHFDHCGGAAAFSEKFSCPVFIHTDDYEMVKDPELNLSSIMKSRPYTPPTDVHTYEENDQFPLGDEVFTVIHTPGHTKGSCCFSTKGILFSGDTLFYRSIGRTDFPGGSYTAIGNSIQNKLYKLDDNTIVYPGHGDDTTIGDEKKLNSCFRG